MGSYKNSGGAAKQSIWRTGALKVARAIKADTQMVVNRITYHSGTKVWIDQADRKPGDPYQRPREWSEYIENQPERLRCTADDLENIARAALALSKSCRRQAEVAEAEVRARRTENAKAVAALTAERQRNGL